MPTIRTAIFTTRDQTTLTIHVAASEPEEPMLVQFGSAAAAARLKRGTNQTVVGKGVFKLFTTAPVKVVMDTDGGEVLSAEDEKRDGFPDPKLTESAPVQQMLQGFQASALQEFFKSGARKL